MELSEIIGCTAAFLTTICFVPQVVKIIRTGNTEAISLVMYAVFSTGVALWLAYGIMINKFPIILSNIPTLILSLTILFMKIRNEIRKK